MSTGTIYGRCHTFKGEEGNPGVIMIPVHDPERTWTYSVDPTTVTLNGHPAKGLLEVVEFMIGYSQVFGSPVNPNFTNQVNDVVEADGLTLTATE